MKVTGIEPVGAEVQIDVEEEVIETDGVTNPFTTMVIALLVAGLPVTHTALDVITAVITCPVVRADVV